MAADPDAGMETCPSPEIGDSRKRPLDSDTENGTTKRSHFSSGKLMPITVCIQYNNNKTKQNKTIFFFFADFVECFTTVGSNVLLILLLFNCVYCVYCLFFLT